MGNIKSKRDPSTLSDAEIQLLLHKTDLSRDDILEWHKEFIEEHPDGQVSYDEFLRLYKGIINPNVEGEKYAKALFTFFDNEKNDKLAFSDFLVLTPFEVRPKQVAAEEPVKKESEEVEKAAEEAKEEENKENKEGDNKEGEAEEKKEGEPQENKEDEKKEEAKENKEDDKEGETKEGEAQEKKEDEKKEEAQENKEGETKDGEAQENKDSDNKEVKEEAKENGDEEAAKTKTTSKPLEIDDVDEKTLELALAILNERDEKIDKEELFKIPYILCETAGENAASIFETDEQFAKKKFFLFENDKLDRDEFLRLIRAAKRFAAQ